MWSGDGGLGEEPRSRNGLSWKQKLQSYYLSVDEFFDGYKHFVSSNDEETDILADSFYNYRMEILSSK